MYSRRPPKVCPGQQKIFYKIGQKRLELITSYIVLQDDVVMIDVVVDEVNLGCEHMIEVKFQLLCHLERQER